MTALSQPENACGYESRSPVFCVGDRQVEHQAQLPTREVSGSSMPHPVRSDDRRPPPTNYVLDRVNIDHQRPAADATQVLLDLP
jgi:hypothetical protein